MTTADLNGDGHTDLVLQGTSAIDVFLGNADGILSTPNSRYPGPHGVQSMLLRDIDADGHPDLLLEGANGHLAILYANPDGTLQTSRSFSANQPALTGALGTFTTTGTLDAIVSTAAAQAQLLHGNGDGTFTTLAAPTSSTTGNAGTVLTGDFNGD